MPASLSQAHPAPPSTHAIEFLLETDPRVLGNAAIAFVADLHRRFNRRRLDLLDTRDNITCGVALLRSLNRSARTQDEVIAAYYQGLTSVRERGYYDDTRLYVRQVRATMARLSGS